MSDRPLADVCRECPIRERIDCNKAVLLRTVENQRSRKIDFVFSDKPEESLQRQLHLQPIDTKTLYGNLGDEPSYTKKTTRHNFVKEFYEKEIAKRNFSVARRQSFLDTFEESLGACKGPVKDGFWRQMLCGVSMMYMIVPPYNLIQKQQIAREIKANTHGMSSNWHHIEEEKYRRT